MNDRKYVYVVIAAQGQVPKERHLFQDRTEAFAKLSELEKNPDYTLALLRIPR